MKCEKFDIYLAGELSKKELLEHKETCLYCNKAYEADRSLMIKAEKLNADLKVPDLWTEIQHDIILAADKKGTHFNKANIFAWASAAAFLVILSFWIVANKAPVETRSNLLTSKTLEDVKNAEKKYINAIEELEALAQDKLSGTEEPLAQLYRNKIKLIDGQINSCRKALEGNSANAHIRRYLLAALQDMQSTLNEIIELES